jgi:hypothetical protein
MPKSRANQPEGGKAQTFRAADFKDGKEQEVLIRVLLQGYSVPTTHGRVDRRYWKDRSDDENIGRKALADALRSGRPLSQYTRELLAALFDSQDDKHPAIKRRIKFEERRRGRKRNNFNDTLIANHIYETVRQGGASIEDGINSAAEQFELGDDRVKEIWRGYGPALKEIFGPLPRSPRKPNRVP